MTPRTTQALKFRTFYLGGGWQFQSVFWRDFLIGTVHKDVFGDGWWAWTPNEDYERTVGTLFGRRMDAAEWLRCKHLEQSR